LLGTAHADRVVALAAAVLEHDSKKALELLGAAAEQGLQISELIDQLIEYWRDLLVVNLAGAEARDLSVPARELDALAAQANALTVDTILAGLDVLSATKARLRGSGHTRVLFEMALIRLARLEDLIPISELAARLGGASPAPIPTAGRAAVNQPPRSLAKSALPTPGPSRATPPPEKKNLSGAQEALTSANLVMLWNKLLDKAGPMLAGNLEKAGIPAIIGPKTLVLSFPPGYNREQEHCHEPARVERLEEALLRITGQAWTIRIESVSSEATAPSAPVAEAEKSQSRYRRQRAEALEQPLLKRASEVLGAQVVHMDDGFGAAPAQSAEVSEAE